MEQQWWLPHPSFRKWCEKAEMPRGQCREVEGMSKHRIFVDVGQALLLKGEESGRILHHRRQDGLVMGPELRIAHGRMLLVLKSVSMTNCRLQLCVT